MKPFTRPRGGECLYKHQLHEGMADSGKAQVTWLVESDGSQPELL